MQLSLGNVAGPGPAYRAVLTSDDYGVVTIAGVKDQKIALAEGTWKVVSYTLDATAARRRPHGHRGHVREQSSLGDGQEGRDRQTAVRGRLPRGRHRGQGGEDQGLAPAGNRRPGRRAVQEYLLNGGRPPKPHFVIKDKDDKIVQQGDFEYG